MVSQETSCPVALVGNLGLRMKKGNRLEEGQMILKAEIWTLELIASNKEKLKSVSTDTNNYFDECLSQNACVY